MTNRQWLIEQMQNMSDEELIEKFELCELINKCDCKIKELKSCKNCQLDWLQAEHKEPIKLSDAERVILENVDNDFEWICRDEDNTISVFTDEPSKMIDGSGFWCRVEGDFNNLECFNHLFQFIKWSDIEPYNIEELLKGE